MTKLSFLQALHNKLTGLPQREIEERLHFYCEAIEDRMEEGLSEEEAVSEMGSIKEIAAQIAQDISDADKLKKYTIAKRKLSPLEIVLLVIGSPIWFSLIISAIAVVVSIYAALWTIIISLWSVFAALVVGSFAASAAGIILIATQNTITGLAFICSAMICAGLSIFIFFGCKASTKGTILLTKKIISMMKRKEKTE